MIDNKTVKRHSLIIVICVICLTLITIGSSYAIFFSIKTNSNNQVLHTGNLAIMYGPSSTSITNNDMIILSDAQGIAQPTSSLLYVQNTGSLNSSYKITIGYDYAAFTGRSGYTVNDKLMPLEYINMAIFEYNASTGTTTQIGDVLNLGNLPVYSIDTSLSYNNQYLVLFGNLLGVSSGNNAKTYAIKFWLNDSTPESARYYYADLKISIYAEVTEAKNNYTISGVVNNSGGTPLGAGAKVSIMNDSSYALTDANGAFTLTNVREGTYLIKIQDGDDVYNGTLQLKEGSVNQTNQINFYPNSHEAVSGDSLFGLAYTYATTVNSIKNVNYMYTHDSNSTILTNGKIYTIPSSYVLTGSFSGVINGLTINLGTSGNITSFALS